MFPTILVHKVLDEMCPLQVDQDANGIPLVHSASRCMWLCNGKLLCGAENPKPVVKKPRVLCSCFYEELLYSCDHTLQHSGWYIYSLKPAAFFSGSFKAVLVKSYRQKPLAGALALSPQSLLTDSLIDSTTSQKSKLNSDGSMSSWISRNLTSESQ